MAALCLVASPSASPLSILTEEFPVRLATFNGLTRDMRDAGIAIKALVLSDNLIFVDCKSLDVLSRQFGHELRGMRCNAEGRFARNTATIRGIGVVWFTPVKKQDK
ncbi:hypothetical protein [Pseudomonas sp. B21-048]|uniref:hypothetical protein n=1 Tax=Pseudomonas sp. B21-048 TaxID=2895490 RepID=UPI00215E0713|nr:hypothetical protein [Pseudomonas sp. B21-048]UVK97408.1 hypothetical protein LOY56_18930 [Pseudomonas sp. B21-048]